MAKFYGLVKGYNNTGSRGSVTRLGSTGIKAAAQSYNGSVITELSYNEEGKLAVAIYTSEASDSCGSLEWSGTFEDFKKQLRK